MARYLYHARDTQGESISGVLDAPSLDAACQTLRSEGKFIVNLAPATDSDIAAKDDDRPRVTGRIKRADVIFIGQQLAVMLETGVSLIESLECLVDQCENSAFKKVLADVTRQVQSGMELSGALARYPKVFPNVMTSLIGASEVSGTMSTILSRVSEYMSKEYKTARQAKSALMYPMFLLVMAIGVTIFLLTMVLPRFAAGRPFRRRPACCWGSANWSSTTGTCGWRPRSARFWAPSTSTVRTWDDAPSTGSS